MITEKYIVASSENTFALTSEDLASLDVVRHQNGSWHILQQGEGHHAEVCIDTISKRVHVRLDGRHFSFFVKDSLDQLIEELGMNSLEKVYDKHILAPMPGLVLNILVKEGDVVTMDTPLLILEAMKMENVIKSNSDSIIESIECSLKSPVEKGQLLIKLATI